MIFSKRDEIANLLLPLVFLGLVALEYLLRWPQFGRSFFDGVLVDIILLNVTHNAFTLAILISVPEMQPWLRHQGGGSEKNSGPERSA